LVGSKKLNPNLAREYFRHGGRNSVAYKALNIRSLEAVEIQVSREGL
jgi:hypothetical protein